MVASIGATASASQGVSYYEKGGYYARDDPAHKQASAWAGRGPEVMGLSGAVEPEAFQQVLEGHVPDGRQLGKKARDGAIHHRPGVDVTLSAPKSVSLAALVGGDCRIVKVHDKAVNRTLGWIENKAIQTRMADPVTGAMIRKGNQKMVAARFTHDTSRNLHPQLHTHAGARAVVEHESQNRLGAAVEELRVFQEVFGDGLSGRPCFGLRHGASRSFPGPVRATVRRAAPVAASAHALFRGSPSSLPQCGEHRYASPHAAFSGLRLAAISSRKIVTSSGATMPRRTWLPLTPSTVTAMPSPISTVSPTRRIKFSMFKLLFGIHVRTNPADGAGL